MREHIQHWGVRLRGCHRGYKSKAEARVAIQFPQECKHRRRLQVAWEAVYEGIAVVWKALLERGGREGRMASD